MCLYLFPKFYYLIFHTADPAFIKVVPCGNISNWSKLDEKEVWYEKGHSKISQIFITFEETITSLQFQYVDDEGKMVLSKVHGFNGNGVTSNNFALVILFLSALVFFL